MRVVNGKQKKMQISRHFYPTWIAGKFGPISPQSFLIQTGTYFNRDFQVFGGQAWLERMERSWATKNFSRPRY
jgi:hypothetical protein